MQQVAKPPGRISWIKQKTKDRLVSAGRWREFRREYLALCREWFEPKCRKYRSWLAYKSLLESDKYPESGYEYYRQLWVKRKRSHRKTARSMRILSLANRMPKTQLAQIEAIAAESDRLIRERRKIHKELESEDRAARIAERAAKHKVKLLKHRIQQVTKKMTIEEEAEAAIKRSIEESNNIRIEGGGETDILRDVKWVYDNLSDLIITDPNTGVDCLNNEYLRRAPSKGSVAIAQYALLDRKAFFERFVIKILPKDDAKTAAESDSEPSPELLDPSFGDLEKYMQS